MKAPVQTSDVAVHLPLPPRLEIGPEEADQAVGAGQRVGEDEHPVDQGQTEQAQVHPVLQTFEEDRAVMVSAGLCLCLQ